jgi:hypothetical protein
MGEPGTDPGAMESRQQLPRLVLMFNAKRMF